MARAWVPWLVVGLGASVVGVACATGTELPGQPSVGSGESTGSEGGSTAPTGPGSGAGGGSGTGTATTGTATTGSGVTVGTGVGAGDAGVGGAGSGGGGQGGASTSSTTSSSTSSTTSSSTSSTTSSSTTSSSSSGGGIVCGDAVCSAGETCMTCLQDCGPCPVTCAHDKCTMGVALASACDPCVAQVCAFDSFCCTTEWDEVCRSAVTTVCGQACPDTCAHDICTTGAALQYGCNPCVTAVCDSDSFCCTDAWDYYCLDEVFFSCGIFCP